MPITFDPMRSLLYVNCADEDYRHKLIHWLYKVHLPESISQFEPYVTKYAFYNALPVPNGAEIYGTCNLQMTEHYWNVNPVDPQLKIKAFAESVAPEILIGMGILPSGADTTKLNADDLRAQFSRNAGTPFTQVYVPVWWENDFKGSERSLEHGPNFRWQFLVAHPADHEDQADTWWMHTVLPEFASLDETTRILTSRVRREVNSSAFHRLIEIWFDSPSQWRNAVANAAKNIGRPVWAKTELFPFLTPISEILGIFVGDFPTSNNLAQYRGYLSMR